MSTLGKQIVLATGNKAKCAEFNKMLELTDIEIIPQSRFNVPTPEETGTTFVENAIIKARNAAKYSGLPAIADDSGIEVDCLNGRPGVYSSRYSGEHATDEENLNKLIEEVSAFPENQRTARYWCVLVFMKNEFDPTPVICQRSWEGKIILEKKGKNGFGYDPSFLIPLLGQTAAEISPELKNKLSHRGQAMHDMLDVLLKKFGA
ncbi:MAG: RdgB/HAM1 family non-canonical purine NTP pyrophosphatase [Ruminobacter sp.]|uniref:RdgB/HAM1 family non-canonical purine NTP pyrophosphatase n=1 Tax=Ruminobacter TaxID=866 RepID=UPI0004E187C3|nr:MULTISPECIES: RdgB/HAM1 family non-canonical purine NTP pyrophosphatase [unclassified Ruminobacter]MBQ3774596.1 RdgB/HAM1 family non-canonical purine NTP pyrophosphatase [Ruminobacter sp.]